MTIHSIEPHDPSPGEVIRNLETRLAMLERDNNILRRQLADAENRLCEIDLKAMSQGRHERLAVEVGALCDRKNEAYGNTGTSTGKMLAYFYPNGVPVDQYNRMLILARMFDKIARLTNLGGGRRALGEDAARDLVGYALVLCDLLDSEEGDEE